MSKNAQLIAVVEGQTAMYEVSMSQWAIIKAILDNTTPVVAESAKAQYTPVVESKPVEPIMVDYALTWGNMQKMGDFYVVNLSKRVPWHAFQKVEKAIGNKAVYRRGIGFMFTSKKAMVEVTSTLKSVKAEKDAPKKSKRR